MLRMIGIRLPISAQVNPPTTMMAITMEISSGAFSSVTLLRSTKATSKPNNKKYTGSGMMPILISISRHQRCAQLPIEVSSGRLTIFEAAISSDSVTMVSSAAIRGSEIKEKDRQYDADG